jgi:hypothetical protein
MKAREILKGKAFVAALRRKFIPTIRGPSLVRQGLAAKLGCSAQAIYNWQSNDRKLGAAQVVNLVAKTIATAEQRAQQGAIRPIVEFFDLDAEESKRKKRMELFSSDVAKEHPYLKGLKAELKRAKGVYIFYNSSGEALYAGQARERSLWDEMKSVFNRNRRQHQSIKRVSHPVRHIDFVPAYRNPRKIARKEVPLYELADYMSAYEVPDGLIDTLEAFLVRAFANDLLNVRMEPFPKVRRTVRRSRRKRKSKK